MERCRRGGGAARGNGLLAVIEQTNGKAEIEIPEPTELDQPTTEETHLRTFRRLQLASAALIVGAAALTPTLSAEHAAQATPLYALAVGLAIFTVAWQRFSWTFAQSTQGQAGHEVAQTLAASAVVLLTGGGESPLIFLYYPPLLLAGLATGVGAAVITALFATVGLAIAAWAIGGASAITSIDTLTNIVSLALLAGIATLLGWEMTRSQRNMADAKDRAERFSSVDWLTGLYNRRHLDTLVPQEIARARRHDRPVSLMIVDADHLKDVNDTLGHLLGDQLLIHIAEVLMEQVRLVDTVIRYGGDEFIVIMPDTDTEGAMIPAERIRAAMDGYEVTANGVSVRTSISAGLAAFPIDAEDAIGLMARADAALYVSKRSGRNRITIYHPDLPTDRTPIPRETRVAELETVE
jgi:diguanylate cyclase (GGDEF)-like protein